MISLEITKNNNEKIRIEIPEKIVEDLRTIYGNTIDIDAKVEEILRDFIDARAALEPLLRPDLDAHNTEDEEDDVFCDPMSVFPSSPDPAGVFNPDEGFFPIEWNGSHQLNIMRARAQVMHLLSPGDYPVLGRKLINEILSVVENKTNIVEVKL